MRKGIGIFDVHFPQASRPVHALLLEGNAGKLKTLGNMRLDVRQVQLHFLAPITLAPMECFLPLLPVSLRLKPLPGRTVTCASGGTAVGRLRAPPVLRLIPKPPPKDCFWNEVFIAVSLE